MTTRTSTLLTTFATLALLGVTAGAAAADNTAAAFTKGGTFCFSFGGQAEGQFQHLMLVAEPGTGSAPFNVIPVHGVERGSWKGSIYENTFAGTATESAPASGTGTALHLTLSGGGNSIRKDGVPDMWLVQYAAEVKSDTLAGTIIGYETQTGPIENGKPFTIESMSFVKKDMNPIDCQQF